MKFISKTCTALTALALGATVLQADTSKPNIVFIFADDMSYETLGAADMLDIDTPHLDSMVESGTSFTHAYNMGAWGGAVCAASRSMINNGRFLWQAQESTKPAIENNQMWSQRMQQAGYQTYFAGKWHVPGANPNNLFNVTKNVRAGMPKQTPAGYNRPKSPEDYAKGWKPWETKYGGFWEGGKHWSEVLADDSTEFLETAAKEDKPFFMYLAFNAPHDPRQAPKEYIDRYPLDRIKLPVNFLDQYPYADKICGLGLRDEKLMPYPRTEYTVKVHRQEYFALVTHMDDQIGRILQAVKDSGKADNTYIVFTADHGLAVGHHGLSGKQNMYDHSVRVPFLVVGPDVKAGAQIDTPIYIQDILPTSLALASAPSDNIDFKSLLPLLNDEEKTHYDSIYGAYMDKQRMITKGDWKFISYPKANVVRLFNTKKDPNEMNDLAKNPEYASKLEEMQQSLTTLTTALGDPLLNPNSKGPKKKKAKKSSH
ncbi:sulfatase-like hydrolase/transferase [Rubritalea sp.]|uniref:sulfatase-like hydrolase/transferase n=1 Tax=Rubritalea sp. TaxID=2109375 RepID=UPI003EF6595E